MDKNYGKTRLTMEVIQGKAGVSKLSIVVIGILLFCMIPSVPILYGIYKEMSNSNIFYFKLIPVFIVIFFGTIIIAIIAAASKGRSRKILVKNGKFKISEDVVVSKHVSREYRDSVNPCVEVKLEKYGLIYVRDIPPKNIHVNDAVYVIIFENKYYDQIFLAKDYELDESLFQYLTTNTYKENKRSHYIGTNPEINDNEIELTVEEEQTLNEIFDTVDNAGDRKVLFPTNIKIDAGISDFIFTALIGITLMFFTIAGYCVYEKMKYGSLSQDDFITIGTLLLIPVVANIVFLKKGVTDKICLKRIDKGDFLIVKDTILDKQIQKKSFGSERCFVLKNNGLVRAEETSYLGAEKGDTVYVVIFGKKKRQKIAYDEKFFVLGSELKTQFALSKAYINK